MRLRDFSPFAARMFLLASLSGFGAVWPPAIIGAAENGYEGFGSATPGGSGGTVVEVTNLNDSGAGSLRDALATGSNIRVVFKVGGTIQLQSSLQIRGRSFITIDGSTAPAPGITLKGHSLYIRGSHDIIVSHLRVRDSVSDGILVWDESRNVVIDHCSVTNSADENINITEDTRDVTVSWNIIGDTRSNSFALKSKGMLVTNFNKGPVTNLSVHHNLFINEFQRSPQISTAGLFDIRNNVIRDWGAYGIRIRDGAWGNIINNVFETNTNAEDAVVLVSDAGPVYIQGNVGPGGRNVNSLSTAASLFSVAPVTTETATEVEAEVLQWAGAFPRDATDTALAGAGSVPDPQGGGQVAVTNAAPSVSAGPDRVVTLPSSASLDGSVNDDGLPTPPGRVTPSWSKISGPGTVSFTNPNGVDTTASFSAAGTYVLRLTADDGALSSSDEMTVTVNPAPSGPSVTGFTLINADTDQPVAGFESLNDGAILNLAALPQNLNIRANTSPAVVGSVRFQYDGTSRTESGSPYALAGDDDGNYNKWRPSLGAHTLTATPYSRSNARGTAGTALTIRFTVVSQTN